MKLPRLGLGTVQFGLRYGIANTTGQVPYEEVLRILEYAAEAGATLLDTSRRYGVSEQTIGRALRELQAVGRFTVATKLDLDEALLEASDRELAAGVRRCVSQSMEALGLDRLEIYLLHNLRDLRLRSGLVWNELRELRARGLLGALGVSLPGREADSEIAALEVPGVEVVQIPYNALDHRWEDLGFFQAVTERHIPVISRSSYLKGLLAMDEAQIPRFLHQAIPFLRALEEIAAELHVSRRELALRFALSVPRIACTIVGVDSLTQLQENIDLWKKEPLEQSVLERVREATRGVPELVIVPFQWERYTGRERYDSGENQEHQEGKHEDS